MVFADEELPIRAFLEAHSGELTILLMFFLALVALLILVPQLLRAHQRTQEMQHEEHMRALEAGQLLPRAHDAARAAGRTATLVPMVVVCSAGIVTCFLAGYRSESLFAVALAVWSVAGVVGLAAITGGVALMGRIAQINAGIPEEEQSEEDMPENFRPR